MKIFKWLFVPIFFYSCTKNKIEEQSFTDGKILLECYTLVPDEIQGSEPNTSYIIAKKDNKKEKLLVYETFGNNKLDINFESKIIKIKGLDEGTSSILQNNKLLVDTVFGYKILILKGEVK